MYVITLRHCMIFFIAHDKLCVFAMGKPHFYE